MKRLFGHWIPACAGMTIALLFSFYLMFHTFSYDGQKQEMRIATKAWSDFGAHIPLIRSFSYGPNLDRLLHLKPIESPLFPGEPIRYHFGFYALVGALERLGLRIDWALNIPSALGFFSLLVLIYFVSFSLFHNKRVSFLSVLFYLFNGSLSFVQFFKTHSIAEIVTNSRFPSFGPWDGGAITAFWNLNVYTNQRHLALSYAIVLAILFFQKNHVLTTMLLTILVFTNYAAAAIAGLFLFFVSPVSLLFAAPSILVLQRIAHPASGITWQPGYLSHGNFIAFWWQNLGLHTILIPLGIFFAPKHIRRMLLAPMILLFLLPNLFRFSPDMINNHKFFNFFLILGNMFSAYAVFHIGQIRHIGRISLICLIFFSTLSGVIDFFPIVNDYKGSIPDSTEEVRFFQTQTKPTDVIANSTWFYHPASIAGRSLFSGYTYFTWSYGYDQSRREASLEAIYKAENTSILCQALQRSHIAYVELIPNPESYLQPNWSLWRDLLPVYENPETKLRVYKTLTICNDQ